MAVRNFVGFETGDGREIPAAAGTHAFVSSPVYSGRRAFRAYPSGANSGWARISGSIGSTGTGGPLSAADIWLGCRLRIAAAPASGSERILIVETSALARKLSVLLRSDRRLELADSTDAVLATGATVLAAGRWYHIGVRCGTGTSAQYELRIDGATELSGAGNLASSSVGYVVLGKNGDIGGGSIDVCYDDVVIDDAGWPPAGRVARLAPRGAGAYSAWSGSYADVDEVPNDGDVTYISTSAPGASTFALDSAATAGIAGQIAAVKALATVRDTGGASQLAVRLRSGTTDSDTGWSDPGASYTWRAKLATTDPATGQDWTLAAIDTIEAGVAANAAVEHRCTTVCAMVLWVPVSAQIVHRELRCGVLRAHEFVWRADESGVAELMLNDGMGPEAVGELDRLETTPSAIAPPAAGWDVELLDEAGADVLGGQGADRSATAAVATPIYRTWSGAHGAAVELAGRLLLRISGAGPRGAGVVVLLVRA